MSWFPCPYLKADVELTEERERHITERHPDLLPRYRRQIAETLAAPDRVRSSARFGNARRFSRWYTDLQGGRHLVVVVVNDPGAENGPWIITAYLTRKLAEGDIEWKRS